jgi:uncharacterized protein YdeI (YjbR/CyaY-like superfamily)
MQKSEIKNSSGVNKINHRLVRGESEPRVPTDLQKTLAATPSVMALWRDLTPIARRDFVSWIESAKQTDTRRRRIAITRDKLKAGKRRPCCYAIVPMSFYKALGANPKAKAQWKELTPGERRDFMSWIDSVEESEARSRWIEKACKMLAKGRRRP